ncbi:MAG TPA: signal recognition particle-docking protein FtsY [Bacteroidota bacterium]|nr:signal recognition particle-docking protein FtsY [Bacteroidota bacterium]
MGFLDKFKFSRLAEGLAKTRENLFGRVQKILTGKTRIDDEMLENLEEILIAGDVGVTTTIRIIEDLRLRVRKEGYEDPAGLEALLREEMTKLLLQGNGETDDPFAVPSDHKPHVVMIVGVNGVGKTTTVGKLAYNYRTSGRKVVIAAADTFRAAANEQLEVWATRAGVEIIQQSRGADPAAVAFDALKSAVAKEADVMIIDTAGRLHTKINLMEELRKIKRVLQKIAPDVPHETFLVLDASTGQNAIQQTKQFAAAVGLTGLILTKLDGTAKGGVVLAVGNEFHVPVKFIGVGEQIDDLQPFDRKAFVEALFERNP